VSVIAVVIVKLLQQYLVQWESNFGWRIQEVKIPNSFQKRRENKRKIKEKREFLCKSFRQNRLWFLVYLTQKQITADSRNFYF